MFGYLRFVLALAVLLSHTGIRINGLNPGVIAVVIFYILAGYVVSHLYRDILSGNVKQKLKAFYLDRLLRIYPLYLYTLVITLLFLLSTGFSSPHYTLAKLLANVTIIPLNYYMYLDNSIIHQPDGWLIPPAWSLGCELQAYLLLPLALQYKRLKLLLASASFALYLLANWQIIHPDYFGYRLIFGVFFIFLAGASIQSKQKHDHYFIAILWLSVLMLNLLFNHYQLHSPAYSKETFMGLLLGLPLVWLLSGIKRHCYLNKLLGAFSYGIFLSHFLSIWVLQYLGINTAINISYQLQVIVLALFFALPGVLIIERQIKQIRYQKSPK